MTVHVRGAHYFCLETGNGLGTGEEAPHILPDTIGAAAVFVWRATGQPKSRDMSEKEVISLTSCGHKRFLGTLVA